MEKMGKIVAERKRIAPRNTAVATIAAGILSLVTAACGSIEREVQLCDNGPTKPMIRCIDNQAVGNGFAEVTLETSIDEECFNPAMGKEIDLYVIPTNGEIVEENSLGVQDNFEVNACGGVTLRKEATRVQKISRNGVYTVKVPNENAAGFEAWIEIYDIDPVEKACAEVRRAVNKGIEPDLGACDTCMYDPSIQKDHLETYRPTVVNPDRNSCYEEKTE